MEKPPRLHDLIGHTVSALIPQLGKQAVEIKILSVDVGGIWVESQRLTDATLKKVGRDSLPVTPIIFLPFHQIDLLLLFDESLSLSEQSFGVKD
jgi:hypothetical protein